MSELPEPLAAMGEAIENALDACNVADVLSIITSAFVGLTVELVRRQGEDTNKPIIIDGGDQRDVTIHPPKPAQQTQGGSDATT